MKCPKCHYLSFEPEPRCRNCGYDLALASDDVDFGPGEAGPTRASGAEGPPADLRLRPLEEDNEPAKVITLGPIDLDRVVGYETDEDESDPVDEADEDGEAEQADEDDEGLVLRPAVSDQRAGRLRAVPRVAATAPTVRRPAGRSSARPLAPSTTAELPLFVKSRQEPEIGPGEPMVKVPATPRQPLPVRRPQEAPRPRPSASSRAELRPLERDLLDDIKRLERRVAERGRDSDTAAAEPIPVAARRLMAAAVDTALLGGIATGILWATLRLCGLGFGDAFTLPVVPFAAFLLLVVAGYLLMFTVAGGQTVGKMLARIRVVDAQTSRGGLTAKQAATRALLTVPSALVLGLGFLPALAGQGLALHDRLSGTRVVDA